MCEKSNGIGSARTVNINAYQDQGPHCGEGSGQPDSVSTWTAIRMHGLMIVTLIFLKLGQSHEFTSGLYRDTWPLCDDTVATVV